MRTFTLFLAASLAASGLAAQSSTDLNEGSIIYYDATNDDFDFSWWGKPGRTYFIQMSTTLMDWEYVPNIIESGNDAVLSYGFSFTFQSSGDGVFLRLAHTDQSTTDPANDDFDYDNLTNAEEINIYFTDPFKYDTDGDWLDDYEEVGYTNPNHWDTDGDLLPDYWEYYDGYYYYDMDPLVPYQTPAQADYDSDSLSNFDEVYTYYSDPLNSDTDGDTLNDGDEVNVYGTRPDYSDTDYDGMPDGYEVSIAGLDPTSSDGNGDLDNDGLLNRDEYDYGLDPLDSDSNDNGILDGDEDSDGDLLGLADEIYHGSNPNNSDSDGDGLMDGEEVNTYGTNPTRADSDYDGLPDGYEVQYPGDLDPTSNDANDDADGDQLSNLDEYNLGTNPTDSDTNNNGVQDGAEDDDGDGLTNAAEINTYGTNPSLKDTDSDGLNDDVEIALGLNPVFFDTDGDLLPDGWEHSNGMNPAVADSLDADSDGDGLDTFEEYQNGTLPHEPDTDGDGVDDGAEVAQGSNPNDPSDNGQPPPADTLQEVNFTVGDPSGSHSERWQMTIKGLGPDNRTITFANRDFGTVTPPTPFKLWKNSGYKITLTHVGTDPDEDEADYDWSANVEGLATTRVLESGETNSGDKRFKMVFDTWILDNQDGLLGNVDQGFDDTNYASGKEAYLICYQFEMPHNTRTLMVTQKLEAKLNPSGRLPSPLYKWEIKYRHESSWIELFQGNQDFYWLVPRVAGLFDMRINIETNGVSLISKEKEFEAQFPDSTEILAGQGVTTRMDQAWADTLAATTPTSRREEGYYITLTTNGTTGTWGITEHTTGNPVSNSQGAKLDGFPARPADNPANPTPIETSVVYVVGWFHTHTPTAYRSVSRDVGASQGDFDFSDFPTVKCPGFVYDYTASYTVSGNGAIPAGHPLNSSAQIYTITPPQRRSTPSP